MTNAAKYVGNKFDGGGGEGELGGNGGAGRGKREWEGLGEEGER